MCVVDALVIRTLIVFFMVDVRFMIIYLKLLLQYVMSILHNNNQAPKVECIYPDSACHKMKLELFSHGQYGTYYQYDPPHKKTIPDNDDMWQIIYNR